MFCYKFFPMTEMVNPIITLATDFGCCDGFPAVMHGVILSINSYARIVDISHAISPGNIAHGAYLLMTVPQYFPAGAIHVAVIDPGVGTSRQILAAQVQNHVYIAPDNGLLGYVLHRHPDAEVRYVENAGLWLPNPSSTFHGRDIMAPTAAHLSKGIPFSSVGPVANFWEPAPFPPPLNRENGLQGHIIHIDHFGNLVTNLPGDLEGVIRIGNHRLENRVRTFADGGPGIPVVLAGSSGWLEIAVNHDSAAKILHATIGEIVELLTN
jgi:S-adenosylmethionine hydrolase